MKKYLIAMICVAVSSGAAFAAEAADPAATASAWTLHGRVDSELSVYDYSGEGGSTKDEGLEHLETMRMNVEHKGKEWTQGAEISGRSTDDASVDSDAARLQYFQTYLENDRFRGEAGDVAGSYNQYVYSAGVKGAKTRLISDPQAETDTGWEWETVAGTHEDTWRELYDNTRNTQPDRQSAASNYRYTFGPGKDMGMTVASVHDRSGSIADDLSTQSGKAETVGYDANWRFNRWLSMRADTAITSSDADVKSGDGSHTYGAMKYRVMLKPLPKSLRNDTTYEYVAPGYDSLAGGASQDTERIDNSTTWTPFRELRSVLSLRQSRDNLDHHQEARQTTRDQVLDLTYMPKWLKRGDLFNRTQHRSVIGRSSDSERWMNESGVTLKPFAGFRYAPSFIVVTDAEKTNGTKTDQYTVRNRVGYTKSFEDESMVRTDLTVDRDLTENEGGDANAWNYSLDMGYDYKTAASLDFVYASREDYREENDDTYYVSYLTRLSWYPKGDRAQAVSGSYERRDYDADGVASDYSEDVIKLMYSLSF